MAISDVEQIVQDIQDNSDYDLVGSVAKGRAFVLACRKYLAMGVREAEAVTEHNIKLSPEIVQTQMNDALQWLAANGGFGGQSPSVGFTQMDFTNWRK